MTAITEHGLDLNQPLSAQAISLTAELAACRIFTAAARADLNAGDIRALARLAALATHERQLREALAACRP